MDAHGKGSTTCNLTSRELGLEEEYVAVLTAQRDAEMFRRHRCISVSLTARFSLSFPTMMAHRLRRGSCQMTDQYYKDNQTKKMRDPF